MNGNTPAYAGKTHTVRLDNGVLEKHPRLRGEDMTMRVRRSAVRETPPLTRGRHTLLRDVMGGFRNTPAYAGKTQGRSVIRQLFRKHPRLRGED